MKAIKAQFEGGQVQFCEPPPESGPVEVPAVCPELVDDPWEAILKDPRPRPELGRAATEIRAEIAAGKSKTLDPNEL